MRYFVLLVAIFIIAWPPSLADAQGLPSPMRGLPSLSALWGGGGCQPVCDPQLDGGLTFNVGYLSAGNDAVFDLSADPPVGSVISLRHEYPVNGLWLAVLADRRIGDRVGIYARGAWLVPSTRESFRMILFGETLEPGNWRRKVQWYNVDLAATYRPHDSMSVIGGFRFDFFDTRFQDRDLVDPDDLPTDVTNVTVTSYIPYVGVMITQSSALKAGLIGFPYVPGNVKYDHTWGTAVIRHEGEGTFRNSYFLEAFAEYGRQLMGGHVGVFGIWTYLRGNCDLDVTRTVGGTATPGQYQFSSDRQNWIFGGNFRMNFTSPI